MRLRIFAFLSVLLIAAAPASAREVRYHETGLPAVTIQVPDDWSTRYDNDQNLLLASTDHKLVIVLSLVEYSGSLDYLAAEALKVAKADAPTDKKATRVAGLNGFSWRSHASAAGGTKLDLTLMEVKLDATHTFTCTLLHAADASAASVQPANRIVASIKAVLK